MPHCPDGAPDALIWFTQILTGIQQSAAQIGRP
jgi:hypothetical protein